MLRIERSSEFWSGIINDPSVVETLGMTTEAFLSCVVHPKVIPLASENGGFLLIDLSVGQIAEFHTVFTKKGRGKEAFLAACELAKFIFETRDMAITYETTHSSSKPPLSFGFQTENNWTATPNGNLKLWYLTKSRWLSSPAHRRVIK